MTDPYEEGAAAAERYAGYTVCPYNYDTVERQQWAHGYDDREAELLEYQYERDNLDDSVELSH